MADTEANNTRELTERLASCGYWPAQAAKYLREGRPSAAIVVCRERLMEGPEALAGRLVYARALHGSGQVEEAGEQFRRVLALDPDNLVALKHLGDIRYASGDTAAALSYYRRVLDVDPFCRGLQAQRVKPAPATTTRTITLTRGAEHKTEITTERLRDIPFYTETMGDLYLAQGHPRLALEVYRRLAGINASPRLAEKLAQAEGKLKEKGN